MEEPVVKVRHHCPPRASASSDPPILVLEDKKHVSLANLNMHLTWAAYKVHVCGNLSQSSDSTQGLRPASISSSPSHSPLQVFAPSIASAHSLGSASCDLSEGKATIAEKRLRRMISNRESARRPRMRRKQLIEELHCQVNQLQTINNLLCKKVISLLESNQGILYENSQLRDSVASLQVLVGELLTYSSNVADGHCTCHPRGDATSK